MRSAVRVLAQILFALRLTSFVRTLGIPLPWLLKEIEKDWFGGPPLNWDAKDVESAFDTATRLRGQEWVLGDSSRNFPMTFPGIGRRGGFTEFLRVYWFGARAASFIEAPGASELLVRMNAGDVDASEEASAIHLLRAHNRGADLEIGPIVKVGNRNRKPDFRIRQGSPWVYAEVTVLNASSASDRVHALLDRIATGIMDVEREFLLEVILNREPDAQEEEAIFTAAVGACDVAAGARVDVQDVAMILAKAGDPRVVVPSLTPNDNRPRMAISRAIIDPGRPNRQLIAGVPFADPRAEVILKHEARQLPKNECGLVMVNVNRQPSAFESWGKRIPERFNGGQYTRVAGVILFMHSTIPSPSGLVWLPFVRLILNPRAKVPLPGWIVAAIDRARERARQLTGRPD
jgi:hypothetical protein